MSDRSHECRHRESGHARVAAGCGASDINFFSRPSLISQLPSRMKLVECVPNFSEGRRPEIVAQIRDAIAAVDGVTILDVSSDTSHNRTVITLVVPVEHAVDAAFAGIAKAR